MKCFWGGDGRCENILCEFVFCVRSYTFLYSNFFNPFLLHLRLLCLLLLRIIFSSVSMNSNTKHCEGIDEMKIELVEILAWKNEKFVNSCECKPNKSNGFFGSFSALKPNEIKTMSSPNEKRIGWAHIGIPCSFCHSHKYIFGRFSPAISTNNLIFPPNVIKSIPECFRKIYKVFFSFSCLFVFFYTFPVCFSKELWLNLY